VVVRFGIVLLFVISASVSPVQADTKPPPGTRVSFTACPAYKGGFMTQCWMARHGDQLFSLDGASPVADRLTKIEGTVSNIPEPIGLDACSGIRPSPIQITILSRKCTSQHN
jgi:hypothetical protein